MIYDVKHTRIVPLCQILILFYSGLSLAVPSREFQQFVSQRQNTCRECIHIQGESLVYSALVVHVDREDECLLSGSQCSSLQRCLVFIECSMIQKMRNLRPPPNPLLIYRTPHD